MNVAVITGASSFVGCHLARHFASHGYRVIGTISRSRDGYRGITAERLRAVEIHAELATLDLRDGQTIAEFVQRVSPSLWIQHAGFATNYVSPDYDVVAGDAVNVAPLTPLYSALKGGQCGVIVTGSSAEYGPSDKGNREDAISPPQSPYGQSKLAQTHRAGELAEQYGVPTRVARLYIPFGRLDNPNKLAAQVFTKLLAGKPIALSPCEQKRDFIGIGDVCDAYGRLAQDLPRTVFDVFNIASGKGVVLRDFLCDIADRLDAPRDLLRFGEIAMRPGEPAISFADVAKARSVLGWAPSDLGISIERDLIASTSIVACSGGNNTRH